MLGAPAGAIQAAGGQRATRDNAMVDKVRLSLIHTTEMLEAHRLESGEAQGHGAIIVHVTPWLVTLKSSGGSTEFLTY